MIEPSRAARLAVTVVMIATACFAASACVSTTTMSPSRVTPSPTLADLAIRLPADLDPAADCGRFQDPTPRGLVGLLNQLNCVPPKTSKIAGGSVDAYLFDSVASLRTSFDAVNAVYHFFPGSADPQCPPRGQGEGLVDWHAPGSTAKAGTLECYSTTDGGHIYIWSNEADRTLYLARVTKAISFSTLQLWWTRTGCCR